MLYSNDYINFDLVNKNVLLFTLNKSVPETNEWYDMKDAFNKFLNCCMEKNFKISLLFNINNSAVLDKVYLLDFIDWLKNNENIVEKCIICSGVICNNIIVTALVNTILLLYSTKKPFKICSTEIKAYDFIKEHSGVK